MTPHTSAGHRARQRQATTRTRPPFPRPRDSVISPHQFSHFRGGRCDSDVQSPSAMLHELDFRPQAKEWGNALPKQGVPARQQFVRREGPEQERRTVAKAGRQHTERGGAEVSSEGCKWTSDSEIEPVSRYARRRPVLYQNQTSVTDDPGFWH